MLIQLSLKRAAIAFCLVATIAVACFTTGFVVSYKRYYTPPPMKEVAELVVEEATDGDTLKVKCGEKYCKVRLMGIDTPETKDRRKAIQYCGPEAAAITKKLEGQTLKFVFIEQEEPRYAKRDKYDRLLAYVYTKDGKLFNEELIRLGMAKEYKYRGGYEHRDRFLQAQGEAQEKRRGMWSDAACAKQDAKQ